tara:strand:- start:7900 stop:9039 length:1140 start_codon:yes stop_codon:yes gene_type:complete
MKNILMISPYRQKDGWGHSGQDYIKSLMAAGAKVAARPIYMAPGNDFVQTEDLPEEVLEAENTSLDKYDVVIENVLPHLFVKRGIPTWLMCKLESDGIDQTSWFQHMALADGLLMTGDHDVRELNKAGLKGVYGVGEPIDSSKFEDVYPRFKGIPKNTFNFYFIGEFIERKNLDALIVAFHSEFHHTEPVNLVLKVHRGGIPTSHLVSIVRQHVGELKQKMRVYRDPHLYKTEFIVSEYISDRQMNMLHDTCDCFVMPSRGEAPCRPAVDALGFGNTPIVTDGTGMSDVVTNNNGYVVPSRREPILTKDTYVSSIYTSRETWQEIDVLELKKAMRAAYSESEESKAKKRADGRDVVVENYGHKRIGQRILEAMQYEYPS